MLNIILKLFFSYCFIFFLFLQSAPNHSKKKVNILYILADDLGYADLPSYGGKKIKTPN